RMTERPTTRQHSSGEGHQPHPHKQRRAASDRTSHPAPASTNTTATSAPREPTPSTQAPSQPHAVSGTGAAQPPPELSDDARRASSDLLRRASRLRATSDVSRHCYEPRSDWTPAPSSAGPHTALLPAEPLHLTVDRDSLLPSAVL